MDDLSQKKFFKITNKEEKHHGFQYTNGLNILKEPFAETGSCVPGGLYFADITSILQFLNYGVYLREITLPLNDPDFKIVKDNNKWRANKIILGKKYNLWEKETFEYLVSVGADVHADINFAVRLASEKGYLDVVKYLVELGEQGSPIQPARIDNSVAVVTRDKVSVGADIHSNNDYAIRYASQQGHLDVVKYLVELGEHRSPVQPARIDNNNVVVARDKVSVGANIHAVNNFAVIWASGNGPQK